MLFFGNDVFSGSDRKYRNPHIWGEPLFPPEMQLGMFQSSQISYLRSSHQAWLPSVCDWRTCAASISSGWHLYLTAAGFITQPRVTASQGVTGTFVLFAAGVIAQFASGLVGLCICLRLRRYAARIRRGWHLHCKNKFKSHKNTKTRNNA